MKSQNWPNGEPLSPMDLELASILAGCIVEVAVEELIRKNNEATATMFGEPATLKDFIAGLLKAEGLPTASQFVILLDVETNHSIGWRFVSDSATGEASAYKGQLVTVLAVDGENTIAYACSVANFYAGEKKYFVVKPGDLTGVRPIQQ